jgi:hypothetical protein
MAAYFMNSAKNITLLESDAILIEIHRPSYKKGEGITEESERQENFQKEVAQLNSDPYY